MERWISYTDLKFKVAYRKDLNLVVGYIGCSGLDLLSGGLPRVYLWVQFLFVDDGRKWLCIG